MPKKDPAAAPARGATKAAHRKHAEEVLAKEEHKVKPEGFQERFDEPPHD